MQGTRQGICYVAPDVPIPSPTGASVHVSEVAANLQRLGHDVHVVARRMGRAEKPIEVVEGVTIHRVYRWIVLPERARGPGGVGRETASAAHRAYYVYLRTLFALYVSLVAAVIIRRNRLGRVLERETAFGAGGMASILTRKPLVLEIIGPRYSRLSVSRSSTVLYYTESMLRDWVDRAKCKAVPGGVNSKVFFPDEASRQRARNAMKIDDDATVVGYIGSFQPWHGVGTLIESLPEVLRGHSKVRALLVGPASEPYQARANELGVGDACIFAGAVPYHDASMYINAFDVAVAPYDPGSDELRKKYGMGWPLKVLEYLACEKPVVATDVPPTEKIIVSGSTGLLVAPGSPAMLAKALLRLISDPGLASQLAKNGHDLVEAKYSWKALGEEFSSVIQSAG